jgi:hypothetical protein
MCGSCLPREFREVIGMMNLSRANKSTAGALGFVLLSFFPGGVGAWGLPGQRLVVTKAIDTLPKHLQKFYRDHRFEMPSLAPDGEVPTPTAEERFAVDLVSVFPFEDVPLVEKDFVARYPEKAAEVGRLPWLVDESYRRLVEAFRAGDKDRILVESDAVARLVARLHNPLLLTANGDGQRSKQHGLSARFSERGLEALQDQLKLETDAAVFLDDPKAFIFSTVNATYIWVDNVLYLEELAKRGKAGYDAAYYAEFTRRLGPVLSDRLSRASEAAGSFWYTAWVAAGRPALPGSTR